MRFSLEGRRRASSEVERRESGERLTEFQLEGTGDPGDCAVRARSSGGV